MNLVSDQTEKLGYGIWRNQVNAFDKLSSSPTKYKNNQEIQILTHCWTLHKCLLSFEICQIIQERDKSSLFIVWQRFCEPARLRIAYCLSIYASVIPCLVRHLMFTSSVNAQYFNRSTPISLVYHFAKQVVQWLRTVYWIFWIKVLYWFSLAFISGIISLTIPAYRTL